MREPMVATGRTSASAEPARLELRWLPVTDEQGRTHMEATWISVAPALAPHHAA